MYIFPIVIMNDEEVKKTDGAAVVVAKVGSTAKRQQLNQLFRCSCYVELVAIGLRALAHLTLKILKEYVLFS